MQGPGSKRGGALPSAGVDAFLAALEHPHKPAIVALRQVILGADSRIAEGIKWNAPSFRTTEWFATFHLRANEGVRVILHFGARARDTAGRPTSRRRPYAENRSRTERFDGSRRC